MMIFGEGMNALACVGTNYSFNKSRLGDDEMKRKCPDLAEEKLQKTRDKWNEHRMKKIILSIRLPQKHDVRAYISNVDESMVEYDQLLSNLYFLNVSYHIFTIY